MYWQKKKQFDILKFIFGKEALCSISLLSFRMVTILYYLNDVDEGGQTAFVVADNSTLNESVSVYKTVTLVPCGMYSSLD